MNDLVKLYKKRDNCTVELNKKKLKFLAKLESEEEEEEEGINENYNNHLCFSIEIKHKKGSNDYYLEMMRRNGNREDFINSFNEVIEELKK